MPVAGEPIALWVIPVASLGGVARHVLDVAGHGIPGWRLVFLCPPGPLAEQLRAHGAAVITGQIDPAVGAVTATRTVRTVIRRLQPSLVHGHLAFADLIVALAAAGSPVAVVSTEHGIAGDDLVYHRNAARSRVRAYAHTLRLRRADALIAVSQATLAAVNTKWHPAAGLVSVVIPNGIDPPSLAHEPAAGLRICSLSRLAPEKGLPDLLKAFALIHADHPQARLVMAGEGELDHELRALSAKLGLESVVDFPGHLEAAALLRRSDVLVQLSVWENCSYALLDGLRAGLGVVATPVGGNPEMLPPASLVPREDPALVAAAVIAQGMQPASRPHVPQGWPTIGTMCAQVADVYARVVTR